ncbi:MAG: flavodoxin family protein [Bilophila wadsworthia]
MGKNILCILSSPRQNSNSGLLAEAVLEGAAEHGGKAEVIRLVERNINPCHGCFACTRSDRGCVQHDGMTELYPLIASADALVMATPIYYFNMSGQLKTFIDRCIAVDVGGGKRGLRGKKLAVTMAYEGEDPFDSGCINAIRCFQDICRYTGMELKGQAYGTALEPGAILASKNFLMRPASWGVSAS